MRSGIEINGISLLSAHIIGKKNTAVSFSISEFKKQNKNHGGDGGAFPLLTKEVTNIKLIIIFFGILYILRAVM
jgi:hypothetical protein